MWFTIDDKWHSHPKVIGLTLAAAGLWAKAGSWCNDQLTDGRVSLAAVRALGGNKKLAAELVEAKLWHVIDGGWEFHDWLDRQPSRETVLSKRKADAERKAKGRTVQQESRGSPLGLQAESSGPSPSPSPSPDLTTAHNARGPSLASIGHDTMFNATGRQFPASDWREQLERIGMKPTAERVAVEQSLQACAFRRANPTAVTPAYALRNWDRYAAGNPPLKQVVRAAVGGRYAGPSRVPTAEEYAQDAKEKAPWEM